MVLFLFFRRTVNKISIAMYGGQIDLLLLLITISLWAKHELKYTIVEVSNFLLFLSHEGFFWLRMKVEKKRVCKPANRT